MRILHVTASIDPKSGGPTRSVKGICRALAQAGEEVTLLVLDGVHEFENSCGVKVIYANGAADSKLYDYLCLSTFDIVHLQGLWNWQLHKIAHECHARKIPYVISPRGMLDPWALSVKKWKKRLAMLVYQKRDLKKAVAFHVTAEMERDHVRDLGYTQPCIIAPNGVEVPDVLPEKTSSCPRTAIFLSRLHPGKGLLTLAEAWARVKPQGWIMKVVGPDSYGHKAEVLARLDALGIRNEWQFFDAMNDTEKWSAYRSADLLIHPSVSENFGITIVEGLYSEIPAIATKGAPWKDLVDYDCGWWIDQGVDALADALKRATDLPAEELARLGKNGRHLIDQKYVWSSICGLLLKGYRTIVCHQP